MNSKYPIALLSPLSGMCANFHLLNPHKSFSRPVINYARSGRAGVFLRHQICLRVRSKRTYGNMGTLFQAISEESGGQSIKYGTFESEGGRPKSDRGKGGSAMWKTRKKNARHMMT